SLLGMQIPITIACLVLLAPLWAADKYVICPSDNGMTNEVRNMFVDTHNKLRLSYDCDMEANMMKWAKQCHFYHPPPAYRNYWGQNIYMVGDAYYNFTWPSIAETAVISWWQELQVFGVPENNIVVAPDEHKTGHYMQ
ncbi:hypothetical protein GCK32_017617, partial [Trichostrongylus colubriformis]